MGLSRNRGHRGLFFSFFFCALLWVPLLQGLHKGASKHVHLYRIIVWCCVVLHCIVLYLPYYITLFYITICMTIRIKYAHGLHTRPAYPFSDYHSGHKLVFSQLFACPQRISSVKADLSHFLMRLEALCDFPPSSHPRK